MLLWGQVIYLYFISTAGKLNIKYLDTSKMVKMNKHLWNSIKNNSDKGCKDVDTALHTIS